MVPSPIQWERGPILGRGSSAVVSLGFTNDENFPKTIAVKTAPSFKSSTLRQEKSILHHLQGCPQIIRCYGDDVTSEDDTGDELYHIFLELAPHGTLFDLLKSNGPLHEINIRCYTRSIILGLNHIHRNGYVHCDVKPHNILMWSLEDVKIADFGLAKRLGEKSKGFLIRGTPLYVAPESIKHNEYEAPADIWALGCTVVEMATGKPAWNCRAGTELPALLFRIGRCDPLPEIPDDLSDSGKDFLRRCLVKDPAERWTAEMLLKHPFVSDGVDDDGVRVSPCAAQEKKGLLPLGQQGLLV